MSPPIAPGALTIPAGAVELPGDLRLPESASGIVLFVHGSGSSRHSPRNRFVADALARSGMGSLLFDLLTPREDADPGRRFDITTLVGRLHAAYQWVHGQPELARLPMGLFGASTGAAAALQLAAAVRTSLAAVVSRGGRPDLAGALALARVSAPTLLIVGGDDPQVLTLNEEALAQLTCEKALSVVPGATHLFEEPGTLEAVSELAGAWFTRHFANASKRPPARPAGTSRSPHRL